MLAIIFWILWVLLLINLFAPVNGYPWLPKFTWAVIIVEFGIIGFKLMRVALVLAVFLVLAPTARIC